MSSKTTPIETPPQDPVGNPLGILEEWRQHLATRAARLSSGDPQVVMSVIIDDNSMPTRARANVLAVLDARLREARALCRQLESGRQRLLDERAPIEREARRVLERLAEVDRQLGPLNEQLALARSEVSSLRSLRARIERTEFRDLADLERMLFSLGFDLTTVEVRNGDER